MSTFAWNTLNFKILPAKSRPGAADRPPRARPCRPYTGIWLRAQLCAYFKCFAVDKVASFVTLNPVEKYCNKFNKTVFFFFSFSTHGAYSYSIYISLFRFQNIKGWTWILSGIRSLKLTSPHLTFGHVMFCSVGLLT